MLLASIVAALICSPIYSEELPGPRIDLPFDLDGDGQSTYGDLYVLNRWIESGGDLLNVVASANLVKHSKSSAVIDVSTFFHSKAAEIVARVGPSSRLTASASASSAPNSSSGSSACPTTNGTYRDACGAWVTPPPLFDICSNRADGPAAIEIGDELQGLWVAYGGEADTNGKKGVALAALPQLQPNVSYFVPIGTSGQDPFEDFFPGFPSGDLVLRKTPPIDSGSSCQDPHSSAIRAMTTWDDDRIICETTLDDMERLCIVCGTVDYTIDCPTPQSQRPRPFAIDAVRPGHPTKSSNAVPSFSASFR